MKTPTIRFYLENHKRRSVQERTSAEPVMAEINYGYRQVNSYGNSRPKPFRISLQCKILPERFGLRGENFKYNHDVFQKASRSNSTVKTKMRRLEEGVARLENKYAHKNIMPTPSEFKTDLFIELGRTNNSESDENRILSYLLSKIERSEDESNMNKRNSLSSNTIKTYKSISRLIENYQLATKDVLTFENFNSQKYWNLWNVLDDILKDKIKVDNPNQPKKQRKQEFGYLVNTLRKYQGALLKTLKEAKEDEDFIFDLALDVYDKNLVLEKQESKKDIYITEDELSKIINSNVSFDDGLQKAKEYIIIGSLTAMRYESMFDTKNAEVENYISDGYNFQYIHSKQFKTSTEVYIPLLKPVKDILAIYDNKFPLVQSNSTINGKLKKLFKYLEIDSQEEITLKTYRSGIIKMEKLKHELITTHDCKKTFYTNLFNSGMNPTAIDNMTHPDATTENRMAKIYNRSTMLDKAKMFIDEVKKVKSDVYTL